MQYIPDSRIKDLSVKYAELEMTLGEIDRARAIFQYGSQHCDPGKVSYVTSDLCVSLRTWVCGWRLLRCGVQDNNLWSKWHGFEVRHGNEDTFREMLRIKRSVQLQVCALLAAVLWVCVCERDRVYVAAWPDLLVCVKGDGGKVLKRLADAMTHPPTVHAAACQHDGHGGRPHPERAGCETAKD